MKKKVYKAFNEQVQAELYSAYMYLAMSLDMEAKNFKWHGTLAESTVMKKNVSMLLN